MRNRGGRLRETKRKKSKFVAQISSTNNIKIVICVGLKREKSTIFFLDFINHATTSKLLVLLRFVKIKRKDPNGAIWVLCC